MDCRDNFFLSYSAKAGTFSVFDESIALFRKHLAHADESIVFNNGYVYDEAIDFEAVAFLLNFGILISRNTV